MLAYSSIAHAGYLLVGLVAANEVGKAAILFYLLVYAVTNLGAFGIIALLSTADRPHEELRDFTGLWYARPALAGLMTVFLLSLGGLPPTAGFVSKWYIFSAAVRSGYYDLAIVGMLSSVVSVFFYLRVVVMMYMAEPDRGPAAPGHRRRALPCAGGVDDRAVLSGHPPDARPRPRRLLGQHHLLIDCRLPIADCRSSIDG